MRTPITTVITWRIKPTTDWNCPRCLDYITWDTTEITFDTTEYTFDVTYTGWLTTDWSSDRYDLYVEDLIWTNVTDLTWDLVTWVSWSQANKIDTFWQ